jgi:hypothetical protein
MVTDVVYLRLRRISYQTQLANIVTQGGIVMNFVKIAK